MRESSRASRCFLRRMPLTTSPARSSPSTAAGRSSERQPRKTMIWKSPYADANIPEASLTSVVLDRAATLGDKPAIVDGVTGRGLSYVELSEGVRRVARGLADRGFAPGDVLGLYSPNLPDYALAVLGTVSLGGIVTTVNPLYTVDELAHQLEDARATVLLTAPAFLDKARAAASRAVGVAENEDLLDAGARGGRARFVQERG